MAVVRCFTSRSTPRVVFNYQHRPNLSVPNAAYQKRQVGFFSATLHSPEIAELSDIICDRPTWVDLKGADSLPDAVQHVVVRVDPDGDAAKVAAAAANVHVRTGKTAGFGLEGREEQRSERLKRLKPQVCPSENLRFLVEHKQTFLVTGKLHMLRIENVYQVHFSCGSSRYGDRHSGIAWVDGMCGYVHRVGARL